MSKRKTPAKKPARKPEATLTVREIMALLWETYMMRRRLIDKGACNCIGCYRVSVEHAIRLAAKRKRKGKP